MSGPGRVAASLVTLLALAAGLAPAAHAAADELVAVRYTISKEINAPPAKVWSHVTSGKSFAVWCPQWKKDANRTATLAKVGDSVDFMDEYGNGGRSIVTYIVKEKELRVAHEPANGSYMCQARILLAPSGTGTKVTLVEQYTDGSKPEDRQATAAKAEAGSEKSLTELARLCESAG
jgi:uncharacterized protein YndB with AHSA1/START domain